MGRKDVNMKIFYLFDATDCESRMAVAHEAKVQGFHVTIGLIHGTEQQKDLMSDFDVVCIDKMRDVAHQLKILKPDLMHVVTLKYSLFAGLAALRYLKMRKLYTLAGLGYVFRSDALKSKILQLGLRPVLSLLFRYPNTRLIFQNRDDMELLVRQLYVSSKKATLIKGSGVYLDRFSICASKANDEPVILMPTRLVHEKGIAIFVQAARILRVRGSRAKFQIAGGLTKHNPKAITREEMEDLTQDGVVEWLGRVDDLPERLCHVSVIAYPSYYGEGVPRVLLESCAAGRAIVTTDHPGCREAVDEGVNGLLVPVKNPLKTADAIEKILKDDDLRQKMEINSRQKAENEFNIYKIVKETVKIYKEFDL